MEILQLPSRVAKFSHRSYKTGSAFPSEPDMCSQWRREALKTEGVWLRLDCFPAQWPPEQSSATDARTSSTAQ